MDRLQGDVLLEPSDAADLREMHLGHATNSDLANELVGPQPEHDPPIVVRRVMAHAFLSPEWFAAVDKLITDAGDLKIPEAMRAAELNVTVTSPSGDKLAYVKAGQIYEGHRPGAPTSITLSEELARKVFVEADTAAGIQAFLAGELVATGDLKLLVQMQMEEPSKEQLVLAKQIAAITA